MQLENNVLTFHKVKPVTSGHRVVLTYNLVHNGPSATPGLNNGGAQHEALKAALSKWDADDQTLPEHLVYMLEHEYTGLNLTLNHLKASDQRRASALLNAGAEAGFDILLCSIERTVSGGVEDDEEGYWGYGSRSRREPSSDKHEIIDIHEDTLKLRRVVRINGTDFLKDVPIKAASIVQKDPFGGRDIADEDSEGCTGNEGGFATQWYRSAGVLILPKSRVLDFQLDRSGRLLSTLDGLTQSFRQDAQSVALRDSVIRVVEIALRKKR